MDGVLGHGGAGLCARRLAWPPLRRRMPRIRAAAGRRRRHARALIPITWESVGVDTRRTPSHSSRFFTEIFMNTSAAASLRGLLAQGKMVVAPGAIDAITARAIERAGFSAAYMTGAGTSATVGYP